MRDASTICQARKDSPILLYGAASIRVYLDPGAILVLIHRAPVQESHANTSIQELLLHAPIF
eukprot:CAMPEP_0181503662 /NCGR_PEP_ID=MMETSP1110-20121109/57048_1 /TAXON_ID=174948 /ORGANISM="Symbiodinium sp., Strain CCMP421" /LENGTH=61 /DNA_ID=CAMNT_0023632403 /DNA_START=325 /DNA_END=510 /DNA_ORIENTATION=-